MALTELHLDFQSDFLSKGLAVGLLVRPKGTLVVGDIGKVVHQKADGSVGLASATSAATMPGIGILELIDTPAPGDATIRYDGDTSLVSGLASPKAYIVGKTPGSLVAEDDTLNPDFPTTGDFAQQIGIAGGLALLFVRISLFKVQIENV